MKKTYRLDRGHCHNLQSLLKIAKIVVLVAPRGNMEARTVKRIRLVLVLQGAIMKKPAVWDVMRCVVPLAHCGGNTPTDVVVVGNSITFHGPKPAAGWYGDWGMAAPSADKDFSHLVASVLNVPISVNNVAIEAPQPNTLPQISAIATKVGPGTAVILEFGDNVRSVGMDAFEQAYGQ